MSGMLDQALRLASIGFAVLPIVFKDKIPDVKLAPNGVYSASTERSTIGRWFAGRQHNLGLAVPKDVVVVDVDPRNGGIDVMWRLVTAHGRLPLTPRERTGSGGVHLLFKRPQRPLRGKLAQGVDLLGAGRYIVCAPSVHHSGKQYVWTAPPWETPLAEMPLWMQDLAEDAPPPAPRDRPTHRPPTDVERRATAYLRKCEPAVSGQKGHATTFRVCCRIVRGFDLDEETALALIEQHYNPRCDPPWTRRELFHKIKQAVKRGKDAWGELRDAEKST